MLALDVKHMDDRRLCVPLCTASTLSFWNCPTCPGLCNPSQDLLHLHNSSDCLTPALDPDYTELPYVQPIFQFDSTAF